MFKIKDGTIYCSRGDVGTIKLKLPITDMNDYIKYEDNSKKIYWYDNNAKILYDSNYNVSTINTETLTMICYQFKIGDKLTFNIYEKNGYNKEPLLKKDILISNECDSADITLTENDTTFGEAINKETVFWYDITLNDNLTVVCYNEDGAREFIEYPSKGVNE
nr:MAG TPA: hypothetical protein [Caudoviricetes sp.]